MPLHAQHGSHELHCDGSVLVLHGYGPWNDVAIANYQRDLEQALVTLPPGWAFLGFFHGEALLTPDAENALKEVVAWRRRHGMQALAIVTGDAIAKPIVLAQLSRVYAAAGADPRFFDRADEAVRWLAEKGFPTAANARTE